MRAWLAGFDRCVFGNHLILSRHGCGLCRAHGRRGAQIEAAVARGAELLSATRPGWQWGVDLDALNIDDPCRCVAGQVFTHGELGGDWTPGAPDAAMLYDPDYGFDARDDRDVPALQRAWRKTVIDLRMADTGGVVW